MGLVIIGVVVRVGYSTGTGTVPVIGFDVFHPSLFFRSREEEEQRPCC
jgi:hypothetical protein